MPPIVNDTIPACENILGPPERALWLAVLETYFIDIKNAKRAFLRSPSRNREKLTFRLDSRLKGLLWNAGKRWTEQVCHMAGIDYSAFNLRLKKEIENDLCLPVHQVQKDI